MNSKIGIIPRITVFTIAVFLMVSSAFAQIGTGRIAGKIIDTETGEPIIGANLILINTSLGAASNIDGEYFVINIPPGNYDISVSYVGYQTQIIRDVRVVSGVTKELNFNLKATFVEVGAVIIEAERVFYEAKSTNTVKVLDAEALRSLPVRGVGQALSIQAGVVSQEGSGGLDGNPTLNVRGGRGGEVLYIIDGVVQNDPLTGANYSQISSEAVAQASLQVGGFEAKYGQAASGVANVTTKTGGAEFVLSGEAVSSEWTDPYGYNLYNLSISGPIIPNVSGHTFFVAAERAFFRDADPSAISLSFNSDTVFSRKSLDDNESSVWRISGKTSHDLKGAILRFGVNYNSRDFREYVHRYAKWNSDHNTTTSRENLSLSSRISLPFSNSFFINVNAGYKVFNEKSGDGIWRDRPLIQWGDTTYNKELAGLSQRVDVDLVGIFFKKGRINNFFRKMKNETFSVDADFTWQVGSHLVESGVGGQYNLLRYYNINPLAIANDVFGKAKKQEIQSYRDLKPFFYGYDIFGKKETKVNELGVIDTLGNKSKVGPKEPVSVYAYLQDRFELEDLVINLGVRVDYLDSKADILRNEKLPFAYGDPKIVDDEDFVVAPKELYISPRLGLGFPVTPTTVFHAQFGTFIQQPRLIDLYTSPMDVEDLTYDNNLPINTGSLKSEKTTQYEFGFRQILGANLAALNLTAFYKNTKGLVNNTTRQYQRAAGGQILRYYGPSNSDFGTIRGVALSVDVARISYVSMSLNYTYSIAEGTGSSTTSSVVATFRNTDGEVPKVIAPLDFDQRHTGTINVSFSTSKDELGWLSNTRINFLASFNSGRPYTPLTSQNILAGTSNYGETRGYINSAYGPGSFLANLQIEKTFILGFVQLTPYIWVENLFDAVNAVTVYRTTGNPYTTAWLDSDEGKKVSQAQKNPQYYIEDYKSFERTPDNFGVPRMIRIGLKMNVGSGR